MIGTIFGYIITGIVVGLLARFFLKGDHNISMLWTIILGAAGSGIGGWLTNHFIGPGHGIISFIAGILVAMLLISFYVGPHNRNVR